MSRLERLLTLIDTGTSEAVRKMAASQIGEIQAARPGELHNLLGAVGQLLLWGKSWETRSAAALAVEAILSNVPTWDPAPVVKQEQEQGTEEKEVFPLAQFKIEEVLKREIFTGGRSGQNIEKDSTTLTTSLANIDVSNSNSSLSLSTSKNSRSSVKNESDANMETRLIKSEQTTESGTATTRSLSEEVCPPTKMIKIEQFDTPVKQQQQQPFPLQLQQPTLLPSLSSPSVPESFVAQVKKEEEHNLCTNITQTNTSLFDGTTDTTESTRVKVMQRIREKEARRALEGQQSKERDIGGSSSSSFSIKNSSSSAINNSNTSSSSASMNDTTRLVKTEQPQDSNRIVLETVKGESNDTGDAPTSWPLQHFGDVLVQELGNKLWEVRHGAALGLRTLLQERHVGGAGKVVGMTAAEMCAANERWVETVAARLLEVLARDRFSDFSAAQSVAPVRETCAQALGVLARSLAPAGAAGAGPAAGSIERVLGVLASMGTQTEWFVRYSALLGIRYVVAVRQDLAAVTVPYVFGTVFALACDSDDDVRAVAAATLVPVADEIIDKALVPTDQLIALENLLWRTLGELDDITSATAPVLELLAVLYANKKSPLFAEASREKFEPYVNILLPYINHPLISVRKSAISMISKLAELPQFDVWFGEHIDRVTSTVYFSLVIDEQMETQLLGLWKTLIIHSKRAVFGSLHLLANWINALRVPAILDLRNAPAIEKGAKLPACLALVPDDQGTSVMLDRDTGSAGFLLGCQAIGIMCAAYPPKMLATALELFRQVFECPNPAAPSQVTALIAATVIGTIGSVAPRATTRAALPPQVLSLMEAFLRRQVAVPCGECNLQLRTAAACAMCFTYWSPPEHLSEVINVMMTLLKHDKYRGFQECAATGLATMAAKTLARTPSPVPKLVRIVAATLAAPLVGECTSRTKLERRGGVKALTCIAKIMKDGLFERIPKLWKLMSDPLISPPSPSSLSSSMSSLSSSLSSAQPDHAYRYLREDDPGYSAVITALCLFSVLLPCVHPSLKPKFNELLVKVIDLIPSTSKVICEEAIKATVVATQENLGASMVAVIEHLLPFLRPNASDEEKIASCRALYRLVADLDEKIVPYTAFFVGPLLSCMSDQRRDVRESAAYGFGTVVKLLPLEASMASAEPGPATGEKGKDLGLPQYLVERRDAERAFLRQLLDGRRLEHYPLPFAIRGTLRKYQQEGINWLAFLRKYHLHGILCDDMGLGKTLQAICAMAASALDPGDELARTRPSIVVCPSTLVGHWANEIPKFIAPEHLRAVPYVAKTRSGREVIIHTIGARQIVVISYEALRNDIELFEGIRFNYCILDEGHLIKNPRSKTTKAVKRIAASSRLILSGTPIQNNVLELWSLFDFLIPGFLGTEQEFNDRFSKPILQSRNPNCSPKDHEAGILALETLHKQVQPLLLRRLKTDVLQDLPPKIVQDYVVDLTPVQVTLYEDFAQHQRAGTAEDLYAPGGAAGADDSSAPAMGGGSGGSGTLRALQYLIKTCDHPAMVLTKSHPMYSAIMQKYGGDAGAINDYRNSAKLVALRDLLSQCGIEGTQNQSQDQGQRRKKGEIGESVDDGGNEDGSGGSGSSHRVLVFAQLKSFLDIIEGELFQKDMKGVSYLRMDGTTPVAQRQEIVDKFNGDPTIDVLLLTTKVGGLGLTLTGADTVIFVEHDWNPKNDLQAMDRAHRIGQTKVVNVYRIITKGTIEEKIMGMQRFKNFISDTVISDEETDKANSLLTAKDTSNLLDLFSLGSSSSSSATVAAAAAALGKSDSIDIIIDKDEEMAMDELPAPGELGGLGIPGTTKGTGDNENEDEEDKAIEKGYSKEFNMEAFLDKNKKT